MFGIRGELKCDPTPAGRDLFAAGAAFECVRGDDVSPVQLASVRPHAGRLLVRFDGVNDANAAAGYTGALLRAERERVTVGPGEFLDADLVGCDVLDRGGRLYGSVSAIEHYPASDMLMVNGTMVPMVAAIVKQIDVGAKRIIIDPPLDLFPSP